MFHVQTVELGCESLISALPVTVNDVMHEGEEDAELGMQLLWPLR